MVPSQLERRGMVGGGRDGEGTGGVLSGLWDN